MKSAIAIAFVMAASTVIAGCTPPTQYPASKKEVSAQPPVQRERLAYLKRTANVPVSCSIGADCTEKWGRAQTWVVQHSVYSVKTNTGTRIETYGPIEPTTDSAFTVTQVQNDAGTNNITFESSCGATPICSPTTLELKSGFNNFVMYGN